MKRAVWFDELKEDHLTVAGGKGASLCKMFQNSFSVPEGFVVTAPTFTEFMNSNSLFTQVFELIDTINFDNECSIEEVSEKIRNIIINSKIPNDIAEDIIDSYKKLTGQKDMPVAVRSSSTSEDLDDASFAGQQETFLYVVGIDDILDKVKRCWASLYNGRAIYYRKKKGFDEKKIAIAVVVQKMINSEKSGVMFTVNPITKSREHVTIEAAWGLGEGIVSGIVTPDSYIVDKRTKEIIEEYVSEKELMVVRKKSMKGVEEVQVPEDKKNIRVLENDNIGELIDLANQLEAFFGKPQDVEWAIENDKLYLLQSRPITTL
jgi:pyruvate,water dikinase